MRIAPVTMLALLAACGSEQSSSLTRAVGACGSVETHVIGVYDPGGSATVVIERPGKHAVVVSANAATTWHIVAKNGAQVVHVYAVGMHRQTVDAPAGASVLTDSVDDSGIGANGYAWPDADTRHLLELAQARVHHDATSFHGCKSASHWTVGEDMTTTSDCEVAQGGQQYDAVLACAPASSGSCGNGSGGSGGSGGGSGGSGGSGSSSGGGIF